jgi:oligopeptide transport system substrate-binding protein
VHLFFILLSLIFLTSCNGQKEKKQSEERVVRLNVPEDPPALHPGRSGTLNAYNILNLLFDGLTRINPSGELILSVAEKVEVSEDQKQYTFFLRDSKWSNGDPVTAFDFEYAWKKILNPSFPSPNAFQLYVIKNGKNARLGTMPLDSVGVKAINKTTLFVELEEATPYFFKLLALPIFFPVNQRIDMQNENWFSDVQSYVSNGPFVLSEWNHNESLILTKNPTYWDVNAGNISHIKLAMVSVETELMMFEKRELDWAGSPFSELPLDALDSLREEQLLNMHPCLATAFFRLNVEKSPFNNVNMRKALSRSLDRQNLIDHVLKGNEIPTTGLIPISMGLRDEEYFEDDREEEARRFFLKGLQELSLTQNTLPELILTYSASPKSHLIAQAVQQQWFQALGIHVKLEAVESKVFFSRIAHQDYQVALGNWFADFDDPVAFLEVFKYKNCSTNNTQWENPLYISLLDQSSHCHNLSVRNELFKKSEKLLIDEMPIIPLFHWNMLYVKNQQVKNAILSPMGIIDFKWASLEHEGKR